MPQLKLYGTYTQRKSSWYKNAEKLLAPWTGSIYCGKLDLHYHFWKSLDILVTCKNKTTENGYKPLLTYQWKVQVNFPAETNQLTHVATVQLSNTCWLQRSLSLWSTQYLFSQPVSWQSDSARRRWSRFLHRAVPLEITHHYHSPLC